MFMFAYIFCSKKIWRQSYRMKFSIHQLEKYLLSQRLLDNLKVVVQVVVEVVVPALTLKCIMIRIHDSCQQHNSVNTDMYKY